MINKKRAGSLVGIHSEYEDAPLVICGVPYDGTCSNRPGTRFGPDELRKEINNLETYSPYQNKDMEDYRFCDVGNMNLPMGNSEHVMEVIFEDARQLLEDDKKILSIGGEHLVTYPVVQAYLDKYPDLNIIHLDAHTDLRDLYFGEVLSHATVMKLIYNELKGGRMFQFGIRSGTKAEFDFGRKHTNLKFNSLRGMKDLEDKLGNAPVYLSIDLDVLDPSVFPGTGTPEPGGVTFDELLDGLYSIADLNIVGADIVELSPHYDASGVSNIVAAKVLREVALMMSDNEEQ